MKIFFVLLFLLMSFSISSLAQSVGIGASVFTPNASSMLEVQSTTKGMLIPRVSLTQTTIAAPVISPATSLIVFNTATINDVRPGYYYWTGTYWARVFDASDGKPWLLRGNAGTNSANDFLGTTDNQPLVIRTNNTEWMRILATGNVGIATTAPSQKLHVVGNSLVSNNMYVNSVNHGVIHHGNTGIGGQAAGWIPNGTYNGMWIENLYGEGAGIYMDGDVISMWSADYGLRLYDEDNFTGGPIFVVDGQGNVLPGDDHGTRNIGSPSLAWRNIYFGSAYSRLNDDQGGSVELGGSNSNAGVGTPYIDFHYSGSSSDYNVRMINDGLSQLTFSTLTNGQQLTIHSEGIAASGANKYMNFNTVFGATGYGFRDNAGVLEYKHSGGIWSPFAQPPTVPGNVEWWIRPTSALFIQPMYNVNARVFDAGQTWAFYYDGSNEKGSFFGGGTVGAVMHRSGVPSANAPVFTYDIFPFVDAGADGTITATDQVTYSGGYAFGSAYNGFTGIGTLDAGLRGIGLGNSSGTNSSWPVVGVIGEVVSTGSYSYGQQGMYGWQAATPGAANYCIGTLGRTSQTGTQSAGVAGYYTSTVGSLITCFSATNYGLIGTSVRGIYYANGLAGSGTKSCVMKTTEGPRALYCVESPENYFEEFGSTRLVNGRARVDMDPLFLQTIVINTENPYKVFIQMVDEIPNGVHIEKHDTWFEVVENGNGTSNAEFDWRFVAKRKGFETLRMEVVKEGYGDPNLYPDQNDPAIPEEYRSSPVDKPDIDKAALEQARNTTTLGQ